MVHPDMKTTTPFALACLLAVAVAVAVATPTAAEARVDVNIQLGLPVAPPLVVVQPGVQVVEDFREEVFFTSGYYWVRRDDGWYRARGPRARFFYAQPRHVPVALVRMPRGQYVHYKHENNGNGRGHDKHEKHGNGRGHDKHGDRGEHGNGRHGD